MELCDYKYANQFVIERKRELSKVRWLEFMIRRRNEQATRITPVYGERPFFDGRQKKDLSDSLADKADKTKLRHEVKDAFDTNCIILGDLSDSYGASIIYYYYILGWKMDNVAREMRISTRSCWRHLKPAIVELDELLAEKSTILA